MSFFGFDQNNDVLARDKERFLRGEQPREDLAVYTWGEESYDGLGDALQEGGDDLNDETFGDTGVVGKDFDFTQQTLPVKDRLTPSAPHHVQHRSMSSAATPEVPKLPKPVEAPAPRQPSLWDEKSPFSVLPRSAHSSRSVAGLASQHKHAANGASPSLHHVPSPSIPAAQIYTPSQTAMQPGRTLEEIEAEMLSASSLSSTSTTQHALPAHGMLTQRQQILQEQQEHQSRWWQQQRNAPPRMHPQSQSPRFHQQQQQHQLLQQQQQQQQHQLREHLIELQEQARREELERAIRAQRAVELQQQQILQNRYLHGRQPSNAALAELHTAQQQLRQQSPGLDVHLHPANGQGLPQNIQRQQRLLSEFAQAAQAEFMRDMQTASMEEQEHLRAEAMRRIMETERMEERRRRKAAKIAHMSRYNDLMTQSDKDFITRIQVSQLVTQDPYADDFYAQVYSAIMRSRLGLGSDERVLKFGSGGGVGLGMGQRGAGRRPNALQRMEQQVERIVKNAREREKERGLHSMDSLRGALGKTSGRSYKAAPRQLLQVDNDPSSPSSVHLHISKDDAERRDGQDAAKEAAKMGAKHLGAADPDGAVAQDPLTRKETLGILENMYDLVLQLEQLRRDQPPSDSDDFETVGIWWVVTTAQYNELVQQLWDGMRVMVPLETSDPHPFISLITPAKGKRLLPRISRHLSSQQMLTMLTLIVACFSQMDVIAQAPILDFPDDSPEQRDLERQTQTFLGSVVQSVLPVVAKAGLRLVSGLLGLLLERSDVVQISQTRPGLAFLTLFLSRVEVIKQSISSATDLSELPTQEETEQWELMFDHLFDLLARHLIYLFPSTRLTLNTSALQTGVPLPAHTESLDRSVWQFLAAMALHASSEQQQILVTTLREKVLENVASATKGWGNVDEEERAEKLANVNLFLHALGLDSSQISL
ncbi:topoisomerase II-associated protein PAT1 [Vararia minispora EC-137]|uniref:Topoisomerase II-associated protein PAT1 n=1 Tax=Vararia minispora EC-137 TaxID=1314806 RepID=A0ACB8QI47_9AGAM|nr:topoisomerase II-associated protein PAT1 [Vararia minispora EC-137]